MWKQSRGLQLIRRDLVGMLHRFRCSYLLDKEHLPLKPNFEDNIVVMNEEDPSSMQAHEKREKAREEKAAKMPTAEEASQIFLKSKQDQLGYLIASTLRI